MITLFLIMGDGKVIRKDVKDDPMFWGQIGMKLASQAEQIIEVSKYGRGKTIKNRFSEKPQYFTRREMIMLTLRAEQA